jgi:ribokinase
MPKIIIAGSLNMDLAARAAHIPLAGETILGGELLESPGGKGANQACAAAKLGGSAAMLGCVGEDDFGRAMRQNLADAGCDVSRIGVRQGSSGVALIFVSEQGENAIVVAPGANAKFSPADVLNNADCLDGATALLLQLESPMETVVAAAKAARERGVLVILDPAPAPEHGLPPELLALVDILTPNETEAAILTKTKLGKLTPDHVLAMASSLLALGPRQVILKLGARGCFLHSGSASSFIPAPKVEAIDTTAAGDVFNGALAVGLSEGKALPEACWFASQAAALSVTKRGAQQSVPSRAELDSFAASMNK